MSAASPYRYPLYYDIAFGFVDPVAQVNGLERLIRRYARIRVRRVLDVCCGPSLQLRELARRGYRGIGLDRSATMPRYLTDRAGEEHLKLGTIRADLRTFRLRRRVDLACIFMGSIGVLRTRLDYLRHLEAVGRALRPGGLYLIQNLSLRPPGRRLRTQRWTMTRDGVRVRATYAARPPKRGGEFTDVFRLEVNDRGRRVVLEERGTSLTHSMAGFSSWVESAGRWEVAAWLHPDLRTPLRTPAGLNWIILRRCGPAASAAVGEQRQRE